MAIPLTLTVDPAQLPPGPAGVGVSGATINPSGHLVLTLTDGTTLDAGQVVPTAPPPPPRPSVVRTWTNWTGAIPLTGGSDAAGPDPYKFYTEFGMAMPQRNPGDVILVQARAEVTNPYAFNVQLDRYIGYGLPDAQQHQTSALSPVRGMNVTPDIHHITVDCAAVIDDQLLAHLGLPLTLPAGWVLTLMMEAAAYGSTPGQYLVNEGPGYGELVAVIFPAT